MTVNAPTLRADATAKTAWEVFTKLSLRHLPVIDPVTHALVGIITRLDLFRSADDAERPDTPRRRRPA
jgi:CBS domain-containing protein